MVASNMVAEPLIERFLNRGNSKKEYNWLKKPKFVKRRRQTSETEVP